MVKLPVLKTSPSGSGSNENSLFEMKGDTFSHMCKTLSKFTLYNF